jgi:hypothetical protein
MSCAEFTISPGGRGGLGVIQPQSGLDYPFVNPSEDIRYLVADFYFAHHAAVDYDTNETPIAYPLRIKRLYGVGCVENSVPGDHVPRAGVADIVIVDANNNVIFDTTVAELITETVKNWGADYKLYLWQTKNETCRLLAYSTWAETDGDKKNYDKYLAPQSAILDSRSVYRIPKNVLSLSVRNGTQTAGPYRGDIVFRNGYNTEISNDLPATVALRRTTRIGFSAEPGTGAGKYPCATGAETVIEYPINSINGVTPGIGGHFLMGAADCLWVRRPTIYTPENPRPFAQSSAQQQIGADCKPCCGCSDYVATAMYMNYTRDRYKLIGRRATDVKSLHETNVARWNAYRQCTIQNPLKLAIVPQRAPFADVALMLCNNCEDCLQASTLQLVITVLSAENLEPQTEEINAAAIDAEVECGYTEVYFPGLAAKEIAISKVAQLTYLVPFPQLKAGDSSYVKFRLRFSARAKMEVKAVLTGTTAGGRALLLSCGLIEQGAAQTIEPAPARIESLLTLDFHLTGKASRLC